jgi:hypothetical protein
MPPVPALPRAYPRRGAIGGLNVERHQAMGTFHSCREYAGHGVSLLHLGEIA